MNFVYGLQAILLDIWLFVKSLIFNQLFTGFIWGVFLALLATGFILTKNPKNLPKYLKYSSTQNFEKSNKKDQKGVYEVSYSQFAKRHHLINSIFTFVILLLLTLTFTLLIKL